MRALARYHYLTARQATLLLYEPSSLSYVQEALTGLFRMGLVARHLRQRKARAGSVEYVYTLSNLGFRYLAVSGEPAETPLPQPRAPTDLFLEHAVCVNDVLVLASLLPKANPSCRILQLEDQFTLRQRLRDSRVVPDGYVDFALNHESFPVAFELDRGTLSKERLRGKIAGLMRWCQTTYQEQFGTDALSLAFVTTAGERRVKFLLSVIEETTRQLGYEEEASRFLVTGQSAVGIQPVEYFLGPVWQRPFIRQLEPLLTV